MKTTKINKTSKNKPTTPDDLAALKKELKNAIQQCDFARAKQLDAHIKSLQRQNSDTEFEKKKMTSKLKFNITRESIGKEIIQCQMKANQEETRTINEFQKRMLKLKEDHQRENQLLDEKLAIELEKAYTRPVPEAESIKTYAQKQATLGNFNVAEQAMEEYKEIHTKSIQQRTDDLIIKFHQDQMVVTARQEAQLANCNDKLQNALKSIRDNLALEISRKNGELNSVSLRLGLGPLREESMIRPVQINNENSDVMQSSLISTAKSPKPKTTGRLSMLATAKSPRMTPK